MLYMYLTVPTYAMAFNYAQEKFSLSKYSRNCYP